MKTVLILFLLISAADPEWVTNFETAKATAAKESKYILLNFSGSDWCGPCIKMKEEVFQSQEFLTIAAAKLVLVRADFPRSKKNQLSKDLVRHNEALAEKYNSSGKFPLTLLLDASGKILKQWDGYVFASQRKFIQELKTEVDPK